MRQEGGRDVHFQTLGNFLDPTKILLTSFGLILPEAIRLFLFSCLSGYLKNIYSLESWRGFDTETHVEDGMPPYTYVCTKRSRIPSVPLSGII